MKELWSFKAKIIESMLPVEQLAREYGSIWEWDHLRPMPPDEQKYWDWHVLPMGWSIIRHVPSPGK